MKKVRSTRYAYAYKNGVHNIALDMKLDRIEKEVKEQQARLDALEIRIAKITKMMIEPKS